MPDLDRPQILDSVGSGRCRPSRHWYRCRGSLVLVPTRSARRVRGRGPPWRGRPAAVTGGARQANRLPAREVRGDAEPASAAAGPDVGVPALSHPAVGPGVAESGMDEGEVAEEP